MHHRGTDPLPSKEKKKKSAEKQVKVYITHPTSSPIISPTLPSTYTSLLHHTYILDNAGTGEKKDLRSVDSESQAERKNFRTLENRHSVLSYKDLINQSSLSI